jgi:hypothetical protein
VLFVPETLLSVLLSELLHLSAGSRRRKLPAPEATTMTTSKRRRRLRKTRKGAGSESKMTMTTAKIQKKTPGFPDEPNPLQLVVAAVVLEG